MEAPSGFEAGMEVLPGHPRFLLAMRGGSPGQLQRVFSLSDANDLTIVRVVAIDGDVQSTIWADRHRGRLEQSFDDCGTRSRSVLRADVPGLAGVGGHPNEESLPSQARARAVLKHVEVPLRVEGDINDESEATEA